MRKPLMHAARPGGTHARRWPRPLVVSIGQLRSALMQAAEEAAMAAVAYAVAVRLEHHRGASAEEIRVIGERHADTLAAEVEALVGRWSAALGAGSVDALAPLAWAIQEVVEWVDASSRFYGLGEEESRVPLTWAPQGGEDEPLTLTDVVDDRLELLRDELLEHRVIIAGHSERFTIGTPAGPTRCGTAEVAR